MVIRRVGLKKQGCNLNMNRSESMAVEKKGLEIKRYFTVEGISPYQMFTYEKRSSIIKNQDGSSVFEINDVEVPPFWTQVATDILAQKYLRKAGVPLYNERGELLLDENGKVITGSETSIKQVAHRIAGCWRHWGEKYGYFASAKDAQNFYEEMVYILINQVGAPNSPQWFTTGLNWAYGLTGPAQGHSYVDPVTKKLEYSKDAYTRSVPHACFIQSVSDDLVREGGIFSLLQREARIFKYGSGTGSNFSNLRGRGERLSGGGTSSGLMSFLKIFDVAAGSIKSGGTTRRAAKMVCLDLDHPEIENFIWWKVREEEKVASLVAGSRILNKKLSQLSAAAKQAENHYQDPAVLSKLKQAARMDIPVNYIVRAIDLAKQGQDLPLREFDTHYESEAYLTVSGQNSNNSVRIPNTFFDVLHRKGSWELKERITGDLFKTIPAEQLWEDIAYCAWASADPGVQFDTTINEWHTCPEDGRINASNPCGEYNFLDDTACNLASINLKKFNDPESGIFNIEAYRHTIRLFTMALEISVLMAQFPSAPIAEKSYQFRTLGLGYANLGSLLMLMGIPYDSNEGRAIAGALTAILTGDSYAASAELAKILGPFEKYEQNKPYMLKVVRNHRRAAYALDDYEDLTVKPQPIDEQYCPADLLAAARDSWDQALKSGLNWGYRNAQATVLAPTGTIGLVMDCDTTGIEPDYSLVKYKKLAGGGFFKIVNQSVPLALQRLGYSEPEVREMVSYCLGHSTLQGCPAINKDTLMRRGLTSVQVMALERHLSSAMDIKLVFAPHILGERFCQQFTGDVLTGLGFSEDEIARANKYVCGTMTLEGAPHLKAEHLAIFDCANKCGQSGQRYIHPYGHLKMLAATQPFISGAISKTINMPKEWTVDQIKQAYYDSWTMMIKAVALYRDGCKLSQPLNSTLEEYPELRQILENAAEEEIPINEVRKSVKIGSRELLLVGKREGQKLTEVSYLMAEITPAQQAMMQALVNSVNFGLKAGFLPSVIAAGSLKVDGHPLIKELSIFLQECDSSLEIQKLSPATGAGTAIKDTDAKKNTISANNASANDTSFANNELQKCSGCGAPQLRRNGTCMLCEVCGETTGCS